MRFSAVFALLPLALTTPIPDNKSSTASNRIKDIGNKQADVANSEVADIQRAKSALKNGGSAKPAEAQLQKDLNKGIALRKTNQALLKKISGGKGRRDVLEEEGEQAGGEDQVVEVRPTQPDAHQDEEQPPRAIDRTVIETRANKPKGPQGAAKGGNPFQKAIDTQNAIEQKQKGATKTVKSLKGTTADTAKLDALQASFQNGNAKLSAFTGQVSHLLSMWRKDVFFFFLVLVSLSHSKIAG